MKNQYVGDIGDYGKYALLKAFSDNGVKLGINWYLTLDDGKTDGKFTAYLSDETFCKYQPEVFRVLSEIVGNKRQQKTVQDIEKSSLFSNALFYSERLDSVGTASEKEYYRQKWFEKSLKALSGAELVFLDPDNGLQIYDDPAGQNAEKYVLPREITAYFEEGFDVVYYCHKGRRTMEEWFDYKSFMCYRLTDALPVVITFHKGTQRSYVFLLHEKNYTKNKQIIDRFVIRWHPVFNEEYTNIGDVSKVSLDEPIIIKKTDGTEIVLEKRRDGKLEIRDKSKAESQILDADTFCRLLHL